MSTIVMRVDLDCDRCYKKIRKVLCKLQDKASIKAISYDEKSNTVTVSGPFDAEEVSDRLCSDAGKVITDIHVAKGNQMKPGAKTAPKQHGKDGHGHGHGGGGKPEKIKHVKFDMDDEGIDQRAHHGNGHGHATAVSRLEAPRAQPPSSMTAMMPMPMPTQTPMPTPTMMPQAISAPSIWPAVPGPEWGYSTPAYGGYYGGHVYDHGGYGPGPYGGYGGNPYQLQYYDEEPSAGCSVM